METTTTDTARVLELVRRLLALSTSNNPHEAAAAAAKAQELLTAHNLTLSNVPTEQREEYKRQMFETGNSALWRAALMNTIAKAHYCSVVNLGAGRLAIIGQPHNIQIAEYVYAFLLAEVDRLTERGWAAYFGYARSARAWKTDFRLGAIRAIGETFTQQRAQQAAAPNTRSMVHVSDAELTKAVATFYPRLQTRSWGGRSMGSGYGAGHAAGKGISINPGVNGASASRRLLA